MNINIKIMESKKSMLTIYNTLKLKRSIYVFKTHEQYEEYSDNVLLEKGPEGYVEWEKDYNKEQMHIVFSRGEVSFYISLFLLAISLTVQLFTNNSYIAGGILLLSVSLGLYKLWSDSEYSKYVVGESLLSSLYGIDDYKVLKKIRLEIIEKRKKENEKGTSI